MKSFCTFFKHFPSFYLIYVYFFSIGGVDCSQRRNNLQSEKRNRFLNSTITEDIYSIYFKFHNFAVRTDCYPRAFIFVMRQQVFPIVEGRVWSNLGTNWSKSNTEHSMSQPRYCSHGLEKK